MAAQDAELKLRVSLDLAFFRQQLAGLGTAAAGYSLPINVKFDRRSVQNELNALERNIRQRKYKLEVATNISSEIKNAGALAKALRGLDNAVQKNKGITNRAAGGVSGATVDASKIQTLLNRATKPAIEALYKGMAKAKIPMEDVGKSTVDSLKASIISGVPAISKDIALGLANGLNPKLKENGGKAARLFIDSFKDAAGIASPSKIFKQLGEFSADGLEIGFVEGLKDFKVRAVSEIKKIVALMRLELASVGNVNIGAGTGAARGGVRGGTQYMSPIGPLPTNSQVPWARGNRGMYGGSGFEPFIGGPTRGAQGALSGMPGVASAISTPDMLGRMQLALPAAGESSATAMRGVQLAARELQAMRRSAARSASVMGESQMYSTVAGQVPVGAGGPFLPAGKGSGGLNGQSTPFASPLPKNYLEIGKTIQGLDPILSKNSVPLAGAIKSLGGEFGLAIKQVLLFGTAYKALAFFTDLPNQAFQASKALQSFNNQLNAITGSASNAKQSVDFINATVERFNIPLQSARDGFLRLYASMEPAGMKPETIENLFTGISQASATLSLSSDQVDRVTYAFSQMASKGKVMSEEVTGQLGDVIPGALSLMADAAGLSMADFKKAMEDGLVSGKAMEQLFTNLPIVLQDRFGKGAEGAAKTLQGQLNKLATSATEMYEAFSPLVDVVAATVLPLLSKAMSDAQSAAQAFGLKINGINPAINLLDDNAKSMYGVFVTVADTFRAIIPAAQTLGTSLGLVGNIALAVLQAFNALAALPIGGFFVKFAINVGIATAALSLFAGRGIVSAIKQLFMLMSSMKLTIASFRTLIITSRAAKIALGGLVAGGIMVLLEVLATKLSGAADEAERLKTASLGAADALRQLSFQELVKRERDVRQLIRDVEGLQRSAKNGLAVVAPSAQQIEMAKKLGLPVTGRNAQKRIDMTKAEGIRQQAIGQLPNIIQEREGRFATPGTVSTITPIDLSEGEGSGKTEVSKLKAYDRDLASHYTNIARTESEAIKQRMDLTSREKEIALATIDFTLKETLARAQYQRDIGKTNELVVADRQQYLADKKSQLDAELKLAEEEFGTVVLSPFTKRAEGEVEAQNKLKESIKALKSGREELSAVEKAEIYIQTELKGKTEEYKDQLPPFIQLVRDAATETDRWSKVKKALVEQLKYTKGLLADAQGKARLAGMLDPRQELREGIRQRLGESATPERIEELAKLEETTMRMEDIKGAIQGVKDEFAGLFSTIITGSGSAQESLAQAFANIGKSFADMAGEMIAQWLYMQAIGLISQMFPGGGSTGLSNLDAPANINNPLGVMPNANGNVLLGGFQAFANGGVVTGPTLGLVGEGRYNEAVVPLPDGRSIPVEMGGAAGPQINSSIVVNVSSDGQSSSKGGGSDSAGLGRKLEGAVKQVIVDELRPGGLLGRR